MNSYWSRTLPAALLALLAACSGKGDNETPAADESGAASVAGARPTDVADLDGLVDLTLAGFDELRRADFDPAALAKSLGTDPQFHFAWVRDNTWWVPYRGLLRGSQGVLLDRVGSNMDRAILLADLLRRSGHRVRLARADLPESRARELLAKIPPVLNQRIGKAQGHASNERKRAHSELMPGLERAMQQDLAESRAVAEKASTLVSSHAEELYAHLKGSAANAAGQDERVAVNAMRDHWWVEREDNGKWIALDVLLPGVQEGSALTVATTTFVWDAQQAMPDVPKADLHSVQLRLIVEQYGDGATKELTVLETALRPAEVLEQPITLMHLPDPWPATLPDTQTDPNAVGNAAVNVREWLPVLRVGDEFIHQSGFTDSGDLISNPLDAKRDIAATGGGGFMSGFAEQLGEGEIASTSLTAEWLEYEIYVPGEQIQRIRRPVFDLPGPARRASGIENFDANTNERLIERYEALLSSIQVFIQTSDLTVEFLAHLAAKSIVAKQATLRELSRERDAAKSQELSAQVLDSLDIWGPLPILGLWRSELAGPSSASFIDRPNVLNYRIGFPAVNADRVVYREAIDIASNSTGVTWGAGRNSFEVRLRQGVIDTVAEVLALGGDFSRTENTAAVFAMAGAGQGRGKFVRPRDTEAVRKLGWPDDAVAKLGADIGAGFAAVALDQPVVRDGRQRVGWWRVDPLSGETIGVMDTGLHGAMDERVEMELHIIQLRNSLRNWLNNNHSQIVAARARARVPSNAAQPGDAELLHVANRLMDVLNQAARAGF